MLLSNFKVSATDRELRTVLTGLCNNDTTKRKAEKLFRQPDQAAAAYQQRIVEIDYASEAWVDCYGDEIHDSPEMCEDKPQGFMWSCCEESSESPGCLRGAHKQGGEKRARSSPLRPTRGSASKRARFVHSPQRED
ncbi:hypothetical protein N657DRAFT_715080 [Parathielavia appendiculata]|uniref:Uncharacterized protein n=1 Tax=Parathielavia appendiculata TaxID=2587402 RepID=A0AAN6Z3N5_9PEZI|nr:hypothetical protein N657DRAFT_715080 [Parathielavia appendiculata]